MEVRREKKLPLGLHCYCASEIPEWPSHCFRAAPNHALSDYKSLSNSTQSSIPSEAMAMESRAFFILQSSRPTIVAATTHAFTTTVVFST